MSSFAEETLSPRAPDEPTELSAVEPVRLTLQGVTKTWSKQVEPVLDHVDLELEANSLVSLIGRNGAGKTTLLRIVSGLMFPDSGVVELDGIRPDKKRRDYQSRIGFLSAGYGGLYARLSVRQHLDLWARLAYLPRRNRRAAIEVAINRFDLRELLATPRVDRLSMGQRQRVRIAMAFMHDPKLVLLDEPWNSLDDEGRELLISALEVFVVGGGTAICCSPTGAEIGIHAQATYAVRDAKVVRL
jgi:ABC-type multidrug transport system ATPase subunit